MRREERTVIQDRNLAVVATWVEAYNAQDFQGLSQLIGEGFRVDDPATGTQIAGWEAFSEIARQVAQTYPDRHIRVIQMLPLGDDAVAVQGVWDGTAAADAPPEIKRGDAVHHVESMVVELVAGKITRRRIYR